MIMTKDNLLRFVREKKYVTPTHIAESFETTTMIASAALSELAKDKLVSITFLKLSASPYYYDPNQKESLMELAEKHLSGYDKEIYSKLKQNEILSDNALSIQERLAIERIKDFAKPMDIEHGGNEIRFWIWYLRDQNETRRLIIEAFEQNSKPKTNEKPRQETKPEVPKENNIDKQIKIEQKNLNEYSQSKQQVMQIQESQKEPPAIPAREIKPQLSEENKVESFIETFLYENYMRIESKNKTEKGILYNTVIKVNKIEIEIDCFYYFKKTTEAELILFYTSSLKPKIVFIENCPKKLFKLTEDIPNLTIVNI